MRILWIVNTIFPYPSKVLKIKETVFGGWLISLLEELVQSNEIKKIGIVSLYNGRDFKKIENGKEVYYLLPCKNINKYNNYIEKFMKDINSEFNPNLVHIHGSEYPHALAFLNACPNTLSVTSIQGLISICGQKNIYNAGISDKDLLKSITFRDILKRDLLINQYKKFLKRGKYEKEILSKSNYLIGRTTWDKKYSFELSNNNNYFKCNENLRKAFYNNSWNINNIERHSIFISQSTYPLKGFHRLLEICPILKEKYKDLKIYVAGANITKYDTFKDKIKLSGYGKYIRKLIKKNNLSDNVIFVGSLKEEEMVNRLLKSNLFLQTSSIENSSNSLGEAMLLGMPIVASNVGGTSSMIKNNEEGYLYPFTEKNMLASKIIDIFDNYKLAIKMGKEAQKHAMVTHDRKINTKRMIDIYKELIND